MNTVVTEKDLAGAAAPRASVGAKDTVHLPISWEDSPAQTVGILDVSGEGGHAISRLAVRAPAAAGGARQIGCNLCPTSAVKI